MSALTPTALVGELPVFAFPVAAGPLATSTVPNVPPDPGVALSTFAATAPPDAGDDGEEPVDPAAPLPTATFATRAF